jgi:hypothetical protein
MWLAFCGEICVLFWLEKFFLVTGILEAAQYLKFT